MFRYGIVCLLFTLPGMICGLNLELILRKNGLCKQAALFPESVSFVGRSFGYDLLKTAYASTPRKEFAFASKKPFLRKMSLEESAVLNAFFRVLIEESEAGYVLFNQKPVCIHGYYNKDPFSVGSPLHKQAVALKEGARIWKLLENQPEDREITIHISEQEDPIIPGYRHIVIINIPLFHAVVKENLPLFQYILGPSLTSEQLLNVILSDEQPFHALLKYDHVLIGKLLGFGIQNSLYVSRIEAIQEAFEKVFPPFLQGDFPDLPFKPSFGYQSLKEEFVKLQEKVAISSEKLIHEKPAFIFGWLKNSENEKQTVLSLEKTQNRIQKLLASPLFLEHTLEKITGESHHIVKGEPFHFQLDPDEKNRVLTKGIWEHLQCYDIACLPSFIDGLDDVKSQNTLVDRKAYAPKYRQQFIKAKENLIVADNLFQKIDTQKKLVGLIPQRLYYNKLKTGTGDPLSGPFATLSYCIFSPQGHCLATESHVLINLKNTILGFNQGVKGMQVGETRELWIHPTLAYGYDTSLEKCIFLRAVVTCEGIDSQNGVLIDEKNPIDLNFLMDPAMEKTVTEAYETALLKKGEKLKQFLKKDPSLDFKKIAADLRNLMDQKEKTSHTSSKEQELINKIHWNIYNLTGVYRGFW